MTGIHWEEPFCGEGNNCFRLGTDDDGNAYIAVAGQEEHYAGQEEHYLTDSREALLALVRDIKAGKADHLV